MRRYPIPRGTPVSGAWRRKIHGVWKICNFQLKSSFILGFLWELGMGIAAWRPKKLRMMGLPGRERSWTISSAVWIYIIHERDRRTDRRTDEQTETGRQHIPRLRIASRGKKNPLVTFFESHSRGSVKQYTSFDVQELSLIHIY